MEITGQTSTLNAKGETLYGLFCRTVERRRWEPAWIERNDNQSIAWTWNHIHSSVAKAANRLTMLGTRPGDRIANLAGNGLEWAVLDLACSAINAIHAPIDPRLPWSMALQCIQQVAPKIVLDGPSEVHTERGAKAAELSRKIGCGYASISSLREDNVGMTSAWLNPSIQADDPACILFTSGTTGRPRGVVLSHRNLVSNALAKLDAMPELETDHRLNFLPFAHAYARTCELSTWMISGCSMETVHGIANVLQHAGRHEPTLINAVPLFYERLYSQWVSRGGDRTEISRLLGKRIRRLASGGSPIRETIRTAFADVGFPIFQGYGLTEASPVVCSNREEKKMASRILDGVGPPVTGTEVRIDEHGELWVRGEGVMLGYWDDEEATQSRIQEGWLRTGDRAQWSSCDGELGMRSIQILGRFDDTIVLSSGYKVDPAPVEQRMRTVAGIAEAVVGRGKNGELVAVLCRSEDVSAAVLQQLVEYSLFDFPAYAKPRTFVFTADDWTTENGFRGWKGAVNREAVLARYHS